MYIVYVYICLVGGFNHLEKYESQLGRIIPYIMENKRCLKPPTSYIHTYYMYIVYVYIYTYIHVDDTSPQGQWLSFPKDQWLRFSSHNWNK